MVCPNSGVFEQKLDQRGGIVRIQPVATSHLMKLHTARGHRRPVASGSVDPMEQGHPLLGVRARRGDAIVMNSGRIHEVVGNPFRLEWVRAPPPPGPGVFLRRESAV